MAHNLFLGMYSFQIKKRYTSSDESKPYQNNDFLSEAYPEEEHKFTKGFAQDIINMIDEKVYKTQSNTHGGILEDKSVNSSNRTLDLLINGGLTGITQYLIDEEGNKVTLPPGDIVGLKFFARIWLPAGSNTAYLFLQKYGSLTIKPIFDSIIRDALKERNFSVTYRGIKPTTTKQRMNFFMKHSTVRDVLITHRKSKHSTGAMDALSATIKLGNLKFKDDTPIVKRSVIKKALKKHGIELGKEPFEIKATYEFKSHSYKEEKTVTLDSSEETTNVIPNIFIKPEYVDSNNSPIFSKMQELVTQEMAEIAKESKKG